MAAAAQGVHSRRATLLSLLPPRSRVSRRPQHTTRWPVGGLRAALATRLAYNVAFTHEAQLWPISDTPCPCNLFTCTSAYARATAFTRARSRSAQPQLPPGIRAQAPACTHADEHQPLS
eukprot:6180367-Pleurochrysis_carterae.AAC.3